MGSLPPPFPGSQGDPFNTSAPPIMPGPVMLQSPRADDGLAIASLVLGILSIVTCLGSGWCVNLPFAIAGLICGLLSKTPGSMRSWGIGLSIAGLAAFVLFIFAGAAILTFLGLGAAVAAGAAGNTP